MVCATIFGIGLGVLLDVAGMPVAVVVTMPAICGLAPTGVLCVGLVLNTFAGQRGWAFSAERFKRCARVKFSYGFAAAYLFPEWLAAVFGYFTLPATQPLGIFSAVQAFYLLLSLWALPLLAEHPELDIISALWLSARAVVRHLPVCLALGMACVAVVGLGAAAGGLGVLAALPVALIAVAVAYRDVFGLEGVYSPHTDDIAGAPRMIAPAAVTPLQVVTRSLARDDMTDGSLTPGSAPGQSLIEVADAPADPEAGASTPRESALSLPSAMGSPGSVSVPLARRRLGHSRALATAGAACLGTAAAGYATNAWYENGATGLHFGLYRSCQREGGCEWIADWCTMLDNHECEVRTGVRAFGLLCLLLLAPACAMLLRGRGTVAVRLLLLAGCAGAVATAVWAAQCEIYKSRPDPDEHDVVCESQHFRGRSFATFTAGWAASVALAVLTGRLL
eukprot:TRINITY_DN1815_c0_g1_i7.p1 TRINITY_DN1815_c0_g1~~TRINITY_DN1815_c0_g1_i7.p1  ORF type:complete len:450 (+),score=90.01 TRINITY_DN1815_c0_g1_i7:265-1614(+)